MPRPKKPKGVRRLEAAAAKAAAQAAEPEGELAHDACSENLLCQCGPACCSACSCESEDGGPSAAWWQNFKEELKEHLAICFPGKAALVCFSFHRVASALEQSMGLPRRALRPAGPAACLHLAAAELLGVVKGQGMCAK